MHLKMSSVKWQPFCVGLNVILVIVFIVILAVHWVILLDREVLFWTPAVMLITYNQSQMATIKPSLLYDTVLTLQLLQ